MISVYDLPNYCIQVEAFKNNNLPIMKKRIELHNRIRKCKSKTKRRKLLKEYHDIKSLCLGLMYGRLLHRPPQNIGGNCNESNIDIIFYPLQKKDLKNNDVKFMLNCIYDEKLEEKLNNISFSDFEKSYNTFLQNQYKEKDYLFRYYEALKKAGLIEKGSMQGGIIVKPENVEKAKQILKEVTNKIAIETI